MLDLKGLRFRAAFFQSIRAFFISQQFLEVDTPIRQPVLIPELNIEPVGSGSWHLQASPELCMKRLLAQGCSRIFQLCHCFRKEESGRLHLEEFSMLEWYRTEADYTDLMRDCQSLLGSLLSDLRDMPLCAWNDGQLRTDGRVIDLRPPWPRLSLQEAFGRYSPLPLETAMSDGAFDEILVEFVEPNLGREKPLFLYDYPVELGSLARCQKENPRLAERFELYIDGIEIANGFSELTDSHEQRHRFEQEIARMPEERRQISPMPERFLHDLDRLDSAAGIALGADRLLMLLMGKKRIDEVLPLAPLDYERL